MPLFGALPPPYVLVRLLPFPAGAIICQKCEDELGQGTAGLGIARAYRAEPVSFAMILSHRML